MISFLRLAKGQKSHGVRPGEYRGWRMDTEAGGWIQRLEDGWNLVPHYKLFYCKGDVIRHIVMAQDPTVSSLFVHFC